jgi:ribosome recycling factor
MTDDIKKAEKAENLPEDVVKDGQNEIQKITDKYTKLIDDLCSEKEKEVLTI